MASDLVSAQECAEASVHKLGQRPHKKLWPRVCMANRPSCGTTFVQWAGWESAPSSQGSIWAPQHPFEKHSVLPHQGSPGSRNTATSRARRREKRPAGFGMGGWGWGSSPSSISLTKLNRSAWSSLTQTGTHGASAYQSPCSGPRAIVPGARVAAWVPIPRPIRLVKAPELSQTWSAIPLEISGHFVSCDQGMIWWIRRSSKLLRLRKPAYWGHLCRIEPSSLAPNRCPPAHGGRPVRRFWWMGKAQGEHVGSGKLQKLPMKLLLLPEIRAQCSPTFFRLLRKWSIFLSRTVTALPCSRTCPCHNVWWGETGTKLEIHFNRDSRSTTGWGMSGSQ